MQVLVSCMVVTESAFVPFRILMKELDELRAASSYLAHQEQGKNQYYKQLYIGWHFVMSEKMISAEVEGW